MFKCRDEQLYVMGIRETRVEPRVLHLDIQTTRGDFEALYHSSSGSRSAVIFLSGAQGGVDGPGGLYPDIARDLRRNGIASLRLNCRIPNDCAQCALDTLVALQYLDDEGIVDAALVGWSFGGAVALSVASFAKNVRAVAAISTTAVSCNCIRRLHSKPILLLHGESDAVCALKIPRRIHSEAVGPRRMIIYANAGHTLEEVKEKLCYDLTRWLLEALQPQGAEDLARLRSA